MRDLSAAFLAEAGATVKRPLWLVQIDFDPVVRLCSWGDITYDGQVWAGADLRVDGIDSGASGEQAGALTLGNASLEWSALILGEGIADRPVRIWQSYLDAATAGVVLPVFSGAGDDAEIGRDKVRLTLSSGSSRWLRSPREYGGDFTIVQPVGFRIPFNNEVLVLERP